MNNEKERRAFEMLQWLPYSLPADFDPSLASQGHYSSLQQKRSDIALDAWDNANPFESSSELKSFKELHSLGLFLDDVYFSPSKARNGFYTAELRRLTLSKGFEKPEKPRRRNRYKRNRSRLASFDAERSGAS